MHHDAQAQDAATTAGAVGAVAEQPLARLWLIAAAVTPLAENGSRVDEVAVAPMVSFLESHGVDGVLVGGTTGEGILLEEDERRTLAEAFRDAVTGRLMVHCGAQTTARTAALAAHAAEIGADGVAVIAPPYYPLDEKALTAHFVTAARACAPLPFYCYAFAARSGYALPVDTVRRIRDSVDNLAGMKVSEQPWDAVEPYLSIGLPLFVGYEPVLPRAVRAGALGAVSALAAVFPEAVRAALDAPSEQAGEHLGRLRALLEGGGQLVAAAKHVLGMRGVPVRTDVRGPLRRLDPKEVGAIESSAALGREIG